MAFLQLHEYAAHTGGGGGGTNLSVLAFSIGSGNAGKKNSSWLQIQKRSHCIPQKVSVEVSFFLKRSQAIGLRHAD